LKHSYHSDCLNAESINEELIPWQDLIANLRAHLTEPSEEVNVAELYELLNEFNLGLLESDGSADLIGYQKSNDIDETSLIDLVGYFDI
jgi:hypothetical protein